ncbi:S8 family serine peptidase [Aliikangiella sp. IMCC44632]
MKNNFWKASMLSTAVMLALAGCSDNDSPKQDEPVADRAPNAMALDVMSVKQWVPQEFVLPAADPDGDAMTVTFFDGDTEVSAENGIYTMSHGLIELVENKTFTYLSISGEAVEMTYKVSANGKSSQNTISIAEVANDPLANQQWHLRNTGQKAYALSDEMKAGLINLYVNSFGFTEEDATALFDAVFADAESVLVAGEDINVMGAYAEGVTGKNAIAVVVDTGLEIRHEDLEPNVLPNRSLNLQEDALDHTDPTSASKSGDHGTSVAGLIASKGWNGFGGRGVAPDTQLIGMNYLGAGAKVEQTDFLVHGFPGSGISVAENVAAFNRSYGITFPTFIALSDFDEAVQSYPSLYLRNGKGALNVKSSGNSFVDGGPEGSFCEDNGGNDLGLTCYDGSFDSSQGHHYYMSVGAVNSDGGHTSYSTASAGLFAAAPSGEYGRYAPAMITTDPMTCLSGASGFFGGAIAAWAGAYGEEFAASQYPFDYPGHPDNAQCNYRSTMNGTSSAAPNTSGVVSLILSANPELTWRDVKHIIASTSTQVDAEDEVVSIDVNGTEFVAHQGWVTNAANFTFNNLYGFGRINAGEAVKMAKNYTANIGEQLVSGWIGAGTTAGEASLAKSIPDNSATGVTHTIEITEESAMTIESVQFKFDVSNPDMAFGDINGNQTTAGSDLAIEVTSPSGTRSVLLASKQALIFPAYSFDTGWSVGYILKDSVLLSNAFYGESAVGTWTIKLLDTNAQGFASSDGGNNAGGFIGYVNNANASVLEGVSLRAFGHAVQAQ